MARKDIATEISESGKVADAVIEEYLSRQLINQAELADAIKKYIAAKQQLEEEEVSDNITIMVRISVSKASGIPIEKLKEMDRPGACGSAPTVLAKRILLFLDVQKKLGVSMNPKDAQKIQTVQDLAEVLYPLLLDKMDA